MSFPSSRLALFGGRRRLDGEPLPKRRRCLCASGLAHVDTFYEAHVFGGGGGSTQEISVILQRQPEAARAA